MTFPSQHPGLECARLEYHRHVQRSVSATVTLFGLLICPAALVCRSTAQAITNQTLPAAASHVPATPPPTAHSGSAPSTGPVNPPTGPVKPPTSPGTPTRGTASQAPPRDGGRRHQDSDPPLYANGDVYYLLVPYYGDVASNNDDTTGDAQAQAAPIDSDGNSADGQEADLEPAQAMNSGQAKSGPPAPDSQPPTVLVFKDGHQIELDNYAIIGDTLYDLTPGHPRKIALADVDLPATEKQNDDHGVTFQLPPSAQPTSQAN